MIEELVEEEMDDGSEGVESEVANVFGEDEEGEGDRERDVREGRLWMKKERKST